MVIVTAGNHSNPPGWGLKNRHLPLPHGYGVSMIGINAVMGTGIIAITALMVRH